MTTPKPPSTLPASDYDAIEAALLESVRGRWFLSEFTRRNRSADTQILLDAISRLENSVQGARPAPNANLIRRDLIEMSEVISRTRREIAAIKPKDQADSQLITATEELDAIVQATEKATGDILEAAEEIQEAAWLLREKGEETGVCDKLDQKATDIYMACSFQDITGQRTEKVVKALRYLESRVNSMIEIWGLDEVEVTQPLACESNRPDGHLLNGPQLEGRGLDQENIDSMISAAEELDIAPDDRGATIDLEPLPIEDVAVAERDNDDIVFAAAPDEIVDDMPDEIDMALADMESIVAATAPRAPSEPVPQAANRIEAAAPDAFTVPEEIKLEDLDWDKRAVLFS